ncbi:MAG: flagellar hook-basal body complex protein FliE [Armatimonadetes bacterium]|nr:flagellar hook-basal body complex protein FliE [Armatimonadota bacterium]
MQDFTSIQPLKSQITPLSNPVYTYLQDGESETAKEGESFNNIFAQALGHANNSLENYSELGTKLASGELENVHDLTIASKGASATTALFQMQI